MPPLTQRKSEAPTSSHQSSIHHLLLNNATGPPGAVRLARSIRRSTLTLFGSGASCRNSWRRDHIVSSSMKLQSYPCVAASAAPVHSLGALRTRNGGRAPGPPDKAEKGPLKDRRLQVCLSRRVEEPNFECRYGEARSPVPLDDPA